VIGRDRAEKWMPWDDEPVHPETDSYDFHPTIPPPEETPE
jgi:hypothetical protein